MQIKYMKVEELIPYENNPRKNDKAVTPVMVSIREFGFKVPILIDKNNVIIAGHTRIRAAKRLKMDEVPVIQVEDLTDDQVKAFRIADNKTSEFAKWDLGALEIELKDIEMDMADFEIDAPEINNPTIEDEFDIQVPKVAVAKIGDCYQLGKHRLVCGDAIKKTDMECLMCGEIADAYITDPPYNVNYEGTAGKIRNDNQERMVFRKFLTQAFENALSALREGGSFYIWHPDGLPALDFRTACDEVGMEVRQCLIWNKSTFAFGRSDYQWKHEPCLYGWKAGAAHYFIEDRTFTTVFDENKPLKNDLHPTMKPVKLIGRLVLNSTKKKEIILDPFAGSGSTLIAAEQLGRVSYSMEIEPKYIDVIINRYEKFTGNKAKKVERGKWDK